MLQVVLARGTTNLQCSNGSGARSTSRKRNGTGGGIGLEKRRVGFVEKEAGKVWEMLQLQ